MTQIGFRRGLYAASGSLPANGLYWLRLVWTFHSGLVLPRRIVIPIFDQDASLSVESVRMGEEDLIRGPVPLSLFAGSGWPVQREPTVGSRLELTIRNRGAYDLEVYGYFEFDGRHESVGFEIDGGVEPPT